MYPFNNKPGEYETKRRALLAKTQRRLADNEMKADMYKNAEWSDQVEKNKISLSKGTLRGDNSVVLTDLKTKTSTSAQTDTIALPDSVFSNRANRAQTDVGNADDSVSDIDDSDVPVSTPQKIAFYEILQLFKDNPYLETLRMPPIGIDGLSQQEYFIGKSGKLYNRIDDDDVSVYGNDEVDWIKTLSKFYKALELTDLQGLKTKSAAFDVLNKNRQTNFKYHIETLIKEKGLNRISAYDGKGKRISGFWIKFDEFGNLVIVNGNDKEANNKKTRSVDWSQSYWNNIQEEATLNKERSSPKLSSNDSIYRSAIENIYSVYPDLWTAKLHPINHDATDSPYVFGYNAHLFSTVNSKRVYKTDKMPVEISNSIDWKNTFLNARQKLIATGKSDYKHAEIMNYLKNMDRIIESETQKGVSDVIDSMTTEIENGVKTEVPGLQGKGLFGAGMVPARKSNRPFNLNDIRGSGSASDMNYKKIGSKFISVKNLAIGKLKLVYPNRTSVGRIRPIGPELVDMLKDLVYDNGNVSQTKYAALEHEDKEIFYEVITACKLQYQHREGLKEPKAILKAEFDKLKGEIMLGNDNRTIVNELKALSIEMFQTGLISKSDFKQISLL